MLPPHRITTGQYVRHCAQRNFRRRAPRTQSRESEGNSDGGRRARRNMYRTRPVATIYADYITDKLHLQPSIARENYTLASRRDTELFLENYSATSTRLRSPRKSRSRPDTRNCASSPRRATRIRHDWKPEPGE